MSSTAAGEETEGSQTTAAVELLSRTVMEISGLPEFRGPMRSSCYDLARRVRLLSPLFDELRDAVRDGSISGLDVSSLGSLVDALVSAKELLRSVCEGSKLYQVLQYEEFASKFQEVAEHIEKALSDIAYDRIAMSEEVKEQVELVHSQFQRAKGRINSPDTQLLADLSLARNVKFAEPAVLKRLSEKLQLRTINDLTKESAALNDMVIVNDGDPDEHLEEMSFVLKKLKDCVVTENPISDVPENKPSLGKLNFPVIPDDFRCPISLELMRDPVIVSTGQTYERSCIQKWLDAGHKTCPKTQQNLSHMALTPNFVLRSLIAQWCETNGVELPKKQGRCRDKKSGSSSDCDRAGVYLLLQKLENGSRDEQRAAAGELRLLAKRNSDNRVCIAEAGAIPLLVKFLSSPDPRTQEHAVTALLNLSINDSNKGSIVDAGAIPLMVEVLKNGSMEARENAAATLFSLSVIPENKITIGKAGAIPPLIDLLCQGSPRGKKDAATALFNLAIYQGNKVKAVKAGIVTHLMKLLVDHSAGMLDEALAILAVLSSHSEGRTAIAETSPIPILVEVVRAGSPRNKENAAAILWSLCTTDVQQLKILKELSAEETLKDLSENGTDRAKRKAGSLLQLIQHATEA
ncbi:Zinc finger RING/FYVE/PHD-type protein [Dioscorea alata]|uniref:Zinc finger RING/FYVE/PHD-type protein n=1 Tax=Dioscorea alata TaxID=55571 RepID=A0ACB7WUI3_DIOAL|nr:Zinc finger RING/FYVE/PHD-type protein [Dioscorea alata]